MADQASPRTGRSSSGRSKRSTSGKGGSEGKTVVASPAPAEIYLEGSETEPVGKRVKMPFLIILHVVLDHSFC